MNTQRLINDLCTHGGSIQTMWECTTEEIDEAQDDERFAVTDDGIGLVRKLPHTIQLPIETK